MSNSNNVRNVNSDGTRNNNNAYNGNNGFRPDLRKKPKRSSRKVNKGANVKGGHILRVTAKIRLSTLRLRKLKELLAIGI